MSIERSNDVFRLQFLPVICNNVRPILCLSCIVQVVLYYFTDQSGSSRYRRYIGMNGGIGPFKAGADFMDDGNINARMNG